MIAAPIMHQSFVVPDTTGPGKSGAFNFSVCKALLKALYCGAGKLPAKSPYPFVVGAGDGEGQSGQF